jgi:hypothetical protein
MPPPIPDGWCEWHQRVEPDLPGDYRACGECWHVFRTAGEVESVLRERMGIISTADEISACPYCAHDW